MYTEGPVSYSSYYLAVGANWVSSAEADCHINIVSICFRGADIKAPLHEEDQWVQEADDLTSTMTFDTSETHDEPQEFNPHPRTRSVIGGAFLTGMQVNENGCVF